jgi:hypothetical protein
MALRGQYGCSSRRGGHDDVLDHVDGRCTTREGGLESSPVVILRSSSRSSISTEQLKRLTRIDYRREMAFVAVEDSDEGRESTLGVARAIIDPDIGGAEFSTVTQSDRKGQRLGELPLHRLMEHQRARGTRNTAATLLAQNSRMLETARRRGIVEIPCDAGDGSSVCLAGAGGECLSNLSIGVCAAVRPMPKPRCSLRRWEVERSHC